MLLLLFTIFHFLSISTSSLTRQHQYKQHPFASSPLTSNTILDHRRDDLFYDVPFDTLDESPLDLVTPRFFPVHLNGIPLSLHIQRTHTPRRAVLSFLFSQGFAATHTHYDQHLTPAFVNMLKQMTTTHFNDTTTTTKKSREQRNAAELTREMLQEIRDKTEIILPIGIGHLSYLLHFSETEETTDREVARIFLKSVGVENSEKQFDLLEQISGQMSVHRKRRARAWTDFFPEMEGLTENDVVEEVEEALEWNWDSLWSSPPTLTPSNSPVVRSYRQADELETPVEVWLINLWRSPVRRLHSYRQYAREKMLSSVRVLSGVDGLSLSNLVISDVLSEGAVLSSSEIGCFLSHLTLWQSVVRTSRPHVVVMEDDALLTLNFRAKVRYYLNLLAKEVGSDGGDSCDSDRNSGDSDDSGDSGDCGDCGNGNGGESSWDVLFVEQCGEMRKREKQPTGRRRGEAGGSDKDKDCRRPVYRQMEREREKNINGGESGVLPTLLRVESGGGCVPSGVRSYVVSQSGARKLAASTLNGLKHPVDVHIANMIYSGKLRAFCTLPAIIATMHRGSLTSSDVGSVPVYHTKIDGKVVYTRHPEHDFPSCNDILCVLQYGVKKKFTPTEVKETPTEEEKEDE